MTCIIIDDEPMAQNVIENYVKKIPYLELKGMYRDGFSALEFLNINKIDLVFLDINMPDITGIQLIKIVTNPPLVIFTTAYPQYAAESYEYNAVDYLLKPIEFDRFFKAVNKANQLFSSAKNGKEIVAQSFEIKMKEKKEDFILVKSGTKIYKIQFTDLLYVEANGNYVNFITRQKKILSMLNMSQVSEMLPENIFQRIHKSFIISLSNVDCIEKHQVLICGKEIPVGSSYRTDFFERIKN